MTVIPERINSPDDLKAYQELYKKEQDQVRCHIAICGDTGCLSSHSAKVRDAFIKYLQEINNGAGHIFQDIKLRFTGCLGLCERGPVVMVYPQGIFYQRVKEEDIPDIVEKTALKGEVVERLLYKDPNDNKTYIHVEDIPFFNKQQRKLIGDNWKLDPSGIQDYLAAGGYSALARAIKKMSPEGVVKEVEMSQLKGRGGAGFPTAIKWQEANRAASPQKYIICNADEGDPGAFMDRSLMEGNPHGVLEGLITGGYAIGANHGIFYIRSEYPTAVKKIRQAIRQAEELGLLGDNILGSGFCFKVTVSLGAGAFVCGETSALITSIEGKVGEPRQKPPHLVERGLWGKPTVINNVETFANIPLIVAEGAHIYRQIGSETSKGTKIFCLVGKVNNTGLVEVPIGMPLREIIFDISGGIKDGKKFKAVQTGGPSGGCIPAHLLETPTDFDNLYDIGSMMGSGGMIVMDEDTCMVDIARYFLGFLKDESCGYCFSCREGVSRMLDLVDDITNGRSTLEELELLKELAQVVSESSMCGLGQTCGNPVLSTIRYFEDEYMAHILDKKCPAGVCPGLIIYKIDDELCNGCGACLKVCPAEAIMGEKKEPHCIFSEKCLKCGICRETCRRGAITKE